MPKYPLPSGWDKQPITLNDFHGARSAGGPQDFYSEGDYWWPNPEDPDGPYIRRDGESNPDNFSEHRHAMVRFSRVVSALTDKWGQTGEERYAVAALKHLTAWFVDPQTQMNPHMQFGQAIHGLCSGRGIGLIDTIHLVEPSRCIKLLRDADFKEAEAMGSWFEEYLQWLCTHPFGIEERSEKNNHGICWSLQAAAFADLTGNENLITELREVFKQDYLGNQLMPDGSMPHELARTKPYAYSIFTFEVLCAMAQILSTEEDNLWTFVHASGSCLQKGIDFIAPYIADKSTWPYSKDILYWDDLPVKNTFLVFAAQAFDRKDYQELYHRLPTSENQEIQRNLPLRHPGLW